MSQRHIYSMFTEPETFCGELVSQGDVWTGDWWERAERDDLCADCIAAWTGLRIADPPAAPPEPTP